MRTNSIENEIRENSLEYAVAVNSDRAIPDANSGLKPVARRILYDAYVTGRLSNKSHVKCADVVGTTMSRFHPHGDSSIYGAMVRLAQDWVMRYPLMDKHGNFGTIFGDGPAAYRYTEIRLAKISEEGLLKNLNKFVVDFVPNYSETEDEPITLPAVFPNLLCNPNEGIGWAMGCSWAPHNLREVAQAIHDYVDGKEPMLPGPDFPTGGIIINKDDIPAIMKTGHGSVKIRGKYNIEKQNIVFYEIPYGTLVERLMEQIGKVSDDGTVENIVSVKNESNKKNLRLVIEVEKGIDPNAIAKQLFAKTDLQTSFSYNQIALVGKTPTELNLKDAIKIYVNHNLDCNKREKEFDLRKAQDRKHIVEGLLKALENIDNIIQVIKKSDSTATAVQNLVTKYELSEIQAKAIVDMKLGRLAGLEKMKLEKENADLAQEISNILDFINSNELQINYMLEKLDNLVAKFGDARRTELTQISVDKKDKEIEQIIPEDVVIVATQTGLIKKIPANNFKVQRRNTKGVKSQDDVILDVIKTNTVDTLMFFTSKGKMYRCLADSVVAGTNSTKGMPISDLIKTEKDERVIAVSSLHRKSTPKYIIFVTKRGMIKKSFLEEYTKTNRNSGIAALKVNEGDEVVDIIFQDEEDMSLITKLGYGIKFKTKDIGAIGRVALGVKGIKLGENDEVVAALPIHKETDNIAIFYEEGMGKKIILSDLPLQARGGKGVIIFKPTATTGNIVDALMVSDSDNVLICGNYSNLVINSTDIPCLGKGAAGNILIKQNKVLGVAKV